MKRLKDLFLRGARSVGRAIWYGLGLLGDDRVVLLMAGGGLGVAGKNLSMGNIPDALGMLAVGLVCAAAGLVSINKRLVAA